MPKSTDHLKHYLTYIFHFVMRQMWWEQKWGQQAAEELVTDVFNTFDVFCDL